METQKHMQTNTHAHPEVVDDWEAFKEVHGSVKFSHPPDKVNGKERDSPSTPGSGLCVCLRES